MATTKRQREDLTGVLKVERHLYEASTRALKTWLPLAQKAVFGDTTTLQAAATPTPDGVYSVAHQWQAILDQELLPVVEAVMVRRMLALMEAHGTLDLLPEPSDNPAEWTGAVREAIYQAPAQAALVSPTVVAAVYAAPGVKEWQTQYLAQVSNRLVRVPDETFDVVRKAVTLSMQADESPRARASRIQEVLNWSGSEDWKGRAMTISRTEATGAFNQATQWAAQVRASEFGEDLKKAWMCTIDGRTRDSHFAADGQTVPLDGTFTVGGASLDHPGDPNGPAHEVINCRCTMLELGPGDTLPGEDDRHTERGPGDGTVRNREGSQADEVERRANRGVDRARDTDPLTASGQETKTMAQKWKGQLAPLGTPTGDGRVFAPDAEVDFRDFPLPLLWQKQTSDMPHSQAFTVGSIRNAWVEDGHVMAEGVLFDTPEGQEAGEQIKEGVTRPSVDLCDDEWTLVDADGQEVTEEDLMAMYEEVPVGEESSIQVLMQFTSFTVMAATLVAMPAFKEAKLELVDDNGEGEGEEEGNTEEETTTQEEEALVASAPQVPVHPTAMFQDPQLTGPTPLHMQEDGRIVGHLALWNDCHTGVGDACVMAPRTRTNYALFHVAETQTEEGPLAVGKLTVGGGHADPKLGVQPTVEHYDNAGAAFALVRAGEDDHGIWVSGVPAPWADSGQVQMGLSSPLSGDWRRHGGNLELVAALSVNTPGFPVPRGSRDDRGRDYALVAAGVMPTRMKEEWTQNHQGLFQVIDQAVREAVQKSMDELAQKSTLEARSQAMAQKAEAIQNRLEAQRAEQLAKVQRTRAQMIYQKTMNGRKA